MKNLKINLFFKQIFNYGTRQIIVGFYWIILKYLQLEIHVRFSFNKNENIVLKNRKKRRVALEEDYVSTSTSSRAFKIAQ